MTDNTTGQRLGRPLRDPQNPLDATLQVRCTRKWKILIKAAAEKLNISVTEFMRRAGREKAER